MSDNQNDIDGALVWLAEMGADEIIGETAVNRFSPPPKLEPAPVSAQIVEPRRGGDTVGSLNTLEQIVAALSVFDACPLKKTATNLCFADGNPLAHVMLIGEAPGRDEDLAGKPFVGRSGQLLDKMLAAIGLSRSAAEPEKSVFITNTIFWRPPGNRTPTEAETSMCLPFLLRAIEIQQPRFIVCLGATPAQRLTGATDGILKLRGKWLAIGKTPLLPTLHPAYLLRQPSQKRLAWRDMLALRQAVDSRG